MITKQNLPQFLTHLGFTQQNQIYTKSLHGNELKIDFANERIIYPKGVTAHRDTTKNFSQPENFVVFECVHNLLQSGYKPEHIILEQGMPGGHGMTGGFCDIIVQDNDGQPYLLIECKTADGNKSKEFSRAWAKMQKDGGQLFNYYNSYRQAQWLCLYASDFVNNQAESVYHLISMKDNDEYLGSNEKLLSFKKVQEENGSKSDYFKVWSETYQQDFISHNLFESVPFNIGNRPYNLRDLKIVDNNTIQKKYHQFATIMRQHNVSARENAFDKLVNLFLCKVVDEKANPENLKVYWKGAASDNHYDLQDRLQQLYQTGMKEFLGEDVTYISAETLDNAFHLFKNQKDETKRTVMEYFTQLKFYSNNPFAFLDVHNEKLFFQNAVILKEIVQMLQDIKLKNEEEQHQFLGDLFEGFLDQGVKQSEGQFFTPMPIVKFLISSLPLAELLQNSEAPKVIDYACGAGHFLTEYASQIKPLLQSGQSPADFYPHIYGVEKEYRLSKVAKVSAFMYGQDEMNIIYADALAQNDGLKDGSFSLLVANPPYSVKGFLATLGEEDKAKFTLYPHVSDEDSFNSIETFFIEKAKQLLHSGGIAVIVLPSSILTNGNIYIKCREIILQYFDLVAIAEFGSGTFGKTGTNTATLFLRRKSDTPNLAAHYQNRIEQWQSGNFGFDGLFADSHLLQNYCGHCGFDLAQYQAFLTAQSKMPPEIAATEVFQEYRKTFDKKKLPKSTDVEKTWLDFAKEIEADKLRHFMLAANNPQNVLVVKMPSETKEKKAFLGYEWSAAKGNEGIKYLGGQTETDEEGLQNLQGINKIQTPLFNPQNLFDETKLNSLIRQNFSGSLQNIPEHLANFATLLPLAEMLDFGRADFDKAIRTSVQKKVEIVSKYPLVKLADVTEILSGGTPSTNNAEYWDNGTIFWATLVDTKEKYLTKTERKITEKGLNSSSAKLLPVNTVIFSSRATIGDVTIAKVETATNQGYKNFICNPNAINYEYLYYILKQQAKNIESLASGMTYKEISKTEIGNFKIPLPPLDIQQKIVEECQKIDDEFNRTRMKIEEYRAKITNIFNGLEVIRGVKRFKISELNVLLKRGKSPKYGNSAVQVIKSGQARGYSEFDFKEPFFLADDFVLDERKLQKGDILINSTGVGTAGRVTLFDLDGDFVADSHITIFRTNDKVLPKFALYSLAHIGFKTIEKMANGASGQIELTLSTIGNIAFFVPDLEPQKSIIAQINEYEAEIAACEQKIQSLPAQKQAVLAKYLN